MFLSIWNMPTTPIKAQLDPYHHPACQANMRAQAKIGLAWLSCRQSSALVFDNGNVVLGCCSLRRTEHAVIAPELQWAILYAVPYYMLGHTVCWIILYAGPYCMLGHTVCWAILYAGPHCMLGHVGPVTYCVQGTLRKRGQGQLQLIPERTSSPLFKTTAAI